MSDFINQDDKGVQDYKDVVTDCILIAVLLFLNLVIFALIFLLFSQSGCPHPSYKSNTKKAMSALNQAIVMAIAEKETDLSKIKNTEQLTEHFRRYLNSIASNSSQITTADGMIYYFNAKDKCGDNKSTDDQDKANCTVVVDINGSKGEAVFPVRNGNKKCSEADLYAFVLKHGVVVPGNNSTSLQGADCTVEALK